MTLCAIAWSAMLAHKSGDTADAGLRVYLALKRVSEEAVQMTVTQVANAADAVREQIHSLTRKNTVSRAINGASDERKDSVLNLEHGSHERSKMAAPPWVVPVTP
ncbi:hypothetical protein AFK62_11740 [Cronobacter condimenti 1330]|nr:hypothetical protein AFK62_11740 [Cronobacter condimenti 1330]